MAETLLIRADASSVRGTGHVFRCLALAQAWQDAGGNVVFVAAELPEALHARLVAEKCGVESVAAVAGSDEDAELTCALAQRMGAIWVVLDGYHFGAGYRQRLRAGGLRILLLDDDGTLGPYHVDAVLNQNLGAEAAWYAGSPEGTRLLLGSHLAMLRREFRDRASSRVTAADEETHLLVSFGGADPVDLTGRLLQALTEVPVPGVRVRVLVGPANPRGDALRQRAAAAGTPMEVVSAVTDMPAQLAWADLALVGAGSTCWELCRLGVPALLVALADNQRPIARAMMAAGAGWDLGWHSEITAAGLRSAIQELAGQPELRDRMARAGRAAVDGCGASRVASFLRGSSRDLRGALRISVVVDNPHSWFQPYAAQLCERLKEWGEVRLRGSADEIPAGGDLAFLLSCERKVPSAVLGRSRHNLVVHASALPQGRGMSPLTWQILEGRDEIPLTLFEAVEAIDAGAIYGQAMVRYRGTELIGELQAPLAARILDLCEEFVRHFPDSVTDGRAQLGEESRYRRRTAADSRLDPTLTLAEQFNLLRVVDNERYPAFFDWKGRRYELRITAKD